MAKHKVYKTNPLRKYIIISLFIFLFIGIGYSILSTSVDLTGIVTIEEYDRTLLGAMRRNYKKGQAYRYAVTYNDSFLGEPTQPIYSWKSLSDADGTYTLNNSNVLFAGYCWQILRTTTTGGTKLLYNGTSNSGVCNRSGYSQQIGTSKFNENQRILADIGYMYNARYPYTKIEDYETKTYESSGFTTSHYFADSYEYDENGYKLIDPYLVSSTSEFANLKGKYSIKSSSDSAHGATLYYIAGAFGSYIHYFKLTNNVIPQTVTNVYTFGDDYVKNNDGTYTITSPTTFPAIDLFSVIRQNTAYLENKYFCLNATNDTCSELFYVTDMSYTGYRYLSLLDEYKFSSSVSYDETSGKYSLDGDIITLWNYTESNKEVIDTHHYTCNNLSEECEELLFIYYTSTNNSYALQISDGNDAVGALNKMLYDDDVNTNDSLIKAYIDAWYENHLISYGNYLEDVIFCNNRAQRNASSNGWNPNGGNTKQRIEFKDEQDNYCENVTDQFSINNPKAKLKYPIGLPGHSELSSLHKNVRATGTEYYSMTPVFCFISESTNIYIGTDGQWKSQNAASFGDFGVRPVISLKPGTEYTSGDGSRNNPYVIDATPSD